MALRRDDIWADLRYALDELGRSPRDIHNRLTDAANLDAQFEDEFFDRLLQISLFTGAYAKAKMRADTRNSHEAIEKGLKAILIDSGLPEEHMRSRGHQLHLLLKDVKQHNSTAFNELERCFDSTIRHLESITTIRHNTDIFEYFRKHGKAEVFVASRYASIEDTSNTAWGMIGLVYMEIIRALLSLIGNKSPKDIDYRIEEAARKAILAESGRDTAWDAGEWLDRGPVRRRLEVMESLNGSRVLRAALRRCARESRDWAIQSWAEKLRRDRVAARRGAGGARRAG